jgi:hypothetical protein
MERTIMSKICIAVVDCVDGNAFRTWKPSDHMRTNADDERKVETYEYHDEVEETHLTDFNYIVEKIGKLDEFQIGYLNIPDDMGKPFYNDPNVQKMFKRHNPRVIKRSDYTKLIEMMRKMIADYYNELLINHNDHRSWRGVLETKRDLWESPHDFPYNLDISTKNITNVYVAEMQIWDLVRMYKTIDWMRNTVILYKC